MAKFYSKELPSDYATCAASNIYTVVSDSQTRYTCTRSSTIVSSHLFITDKRLVRGDFSFVFYVVTGVRMPVATQTMGVTMAYTM